MLEQQFLPGREEELTRHRPRQIAIGLLDEEAVAIIEHVAVESEPVAVPPRALDLARIAEKMRRLPDEIEPYIGEAEVHLDRGRMTAPFGQPLPQHQRSEEHTSELQSLMR